MNPSERILVKLLIRGFGVRVPGGAPVLNCSNSLFPPTIMAWRGTNSIRCFDAQDDHSARLLLTHSDRTDLLDRRDTRQTDRTGSAQSSRRCDRVGRRYLPMIHTTPPVLTSPSGSLPSPWARSAPPTPAHVRPLRSTTSSTRTGPDNRGLGGRS
jgi:hypothetical protein